MVWHKLDSSIAPGLALTLSSGHGTGRALRPGWRAVSGGSLSLPPPAGKPSHALSAFQHHWAKSSCIHYLSFPFLSLPPPDSLSSSFSLFLNIPEDNLFSVAPWETLSPAVAR